MKKEVDKSIGLRIREKRDALGYSRELFAEKAEMSPTFLANIEAGSIGFSESTLVKMCRVLGVSADFILFGSERTTAFSKISEMLSGLDERYLPHAEALVAAYVRSILLAEEQE